MVNNPCQDFLKSCLLLDIEVNEHGVIYALAGILGDEIFLCRPGKRITPETIEELSGFASDARFLLGHNIIDHDIPRLKAIAPGLPLLKKPAIDTLVLSPLAYPANPYHRLVKDYQIVRDSMSNPEQDARLAGRIFCEQWQALVERFAAGDESVVHYRGFLEQSRPFRGTGESLAAMGIPLLTGADLFEAFGWFAGKHGCRTAAQQLVNELHDGVGEPVLYAYVSAWLSVADGNSILPLWVRRRFPQITTVLRTLRDVDCRDPACPYCSEHFDPQGYLERYYGFPSFRPHPATETGESLQGEIVRAAAGNRTMFAVLPTGGGKSLCYLLPAIMRYRRCNQLTIVISPLQALMKDQVDNFCRQTGTRLAAALYGMLTPVERAEVIEAVRLGDIGILYVSPEQLRNPSFLSTVRQREIGAWVFDEAHCLSKWGHDFRPDYLYAIRFIRERAEEAQAAIPPVQCFTATAKKDVRREIVDLIQSELGKKVELFEGGHERTNLSYQVVSAETSEKNRTILSLLQERYEEGKGSVVIYCATRKNTELLAEFLANQGYTVEPFHAGLEVPVKKRLQEAFISGELPIICATNAFGMGIDKEDVRLVIHADVPGSLENYLQEAGRAGRDLKQAECVLVFDEQDIEKQFQLSCFSRLARKDISQILRGIRYAARGTNEVVMTAGDIIRQQVVELNEVEKTDPETRVRTALAWLERAGFLERNENFTRVFQGRPLVKDLAEARKKIADLGLSRRQQERWLVILRELMQQDRQDESFSADELAGYSAFERDKDEPGDETESQRVLKTLHDMAEQGLLTKETTLSAWLRYKVKNSAEKQLETICALEWDFVDLLSSEAWDAEVEQHLELDLRQVNQKLIDQGSTASNPEVLQHLLYGLGRDGRGLAGQKGSLKVKKIQGTRYVVSLLRIWEDIKTTMHIRQQSARVALDVILQAVEKDQKPSATLMVTFTLERIIESLKADLTLLPLLKNPLAAAERALTFMHEHRVIDLQQGLAVFRQAMTIHLHPEARSRRYLKKDFEPLETHYKEQNFQIHVMNEYARQALLKISSAMRLVASYFNDDRESFLKRFFPGRKQSILRATSEQSWEKLVVSLRNRHQQKIVSAPAGQNMLVLAGPGAGKTRVVIHRVAYLLRVERVRPTSILVLCFNRAAVVDLRSRLRDLVGDEMSRVTTLTFHGLALRLTGRSLAVAEKGRGREDIDFAELIRDANRLLRGEGASLGFQEGMERDVLVGRFSHLLVDEYQDIDADQYELISLLVGKSLDEQDQKMSILAVGDDDQNIYRFRGANIEFIRRFREDYQAKIYHLTENFRSTGHIINAANLLIEKNRDRMKSDHPIRVNKARAMLPPGGQLANLDPLARGRVQILKVKGEEVQGSAVVESLQRLRTLGNGFDWSGCAVLARDWRSLSPVRAALEAARIPVDVNWGGESSFPRLSRIRENAQLLEFLRENRNRSLRVQELFSFLPDGEAGDNFWQANLRRLLHDLKQEVGDVNLAVSRIEEYLYEGLGEQARSRSLGSGVFLSTVHSVKGLEFEHVLLLGTNWPGGNPETMEEERRLFYVGMTRPRVSLSLFKVQGHRHPHLHGLQGDCFIEREVTGSKTGTLPAWDRVALLGMKDLFLDFAGIRRENHPVRMAVSGLETGDLLSCCRENGLILLKNNQNVPVARLSKKGQAHWQSRLATIHSVQVVAMVRRFLDDVSDPAFREKCYGTCWELPIVEVRYQSGKSLICSL